MIYPFGPDYHYGSFEGPMREFLRKVKPKRILEWGPGPSTVILAQECPDAEIITIEHQRIYYNIWSERLKIFSNVRVVLVESSEDTPMDDYVNYPLEGKFDFVFVDGRRRVRCLKRAKTLLNPGGAVLLHDAHREEYKEGTDIFNLIKVQEDTACMML